MIAYCDSCALAFERGPGEEWKRRCFRCWRESAKATGQAPRPVVPPAQATIPPERLRELTQLCHPDRHDNSRLSNDITAWLLALRRETAKQ